MENAQSYQELFDKFKELEKSYALLQAKTDRLELAIEAVEDGVWDFNPRTGETYFSPRWFTMLGFAANELPHTYDTWVNLLHPNDREAAVAALQHFLDKPDDLFSIEVRMQTKDGGWRWVHGRGKSIARDEAGNICRMVGTHVDITDRKNMEESLKLTQFIFDKASIGIFRVGADARILDVNQEAAKSLGYGKEELTSMNIFEIDPLTNENNWPQIWQRLLTQGSDKFEMLHRHKDGREIPVFITSNLLEYKGQQFSIAFVQDLTQYKKMEQALFQAQKMEAIGNLAGGIAHDFNNILSGIYGYAQLAQLKGGTEEKIQKYIQCICDGCIRAKELVLQILVFSRQGLTEKSPVDIGVVIKEVLRLLRASIPATIEIQENIGVDLGMVRANHTQIHQVVMNLCTNAAHSLKSRGGKIALDLYPLQITSADLGQYNNLTPGHYLKLVVADNGHGISPEVLPNIFEPYFTTKNVGEGTGMGLATVHGIIREHGGIIKAYSEPGIGTSFHLLFPIVEQAEIVVVQEPGTMPKGTEKILFVDDERDIVNIGKDLFTGLGYSVDTVTSATACLAVFSLDPLAYDLLISDFTMPEMDGAQLIAKIREVRPDLPTILCTGFHKNLLSSEIKALSIDAILMKPVSAFEFAGTVRKVLDARKLPKNDT